MTENFIEPCFPLNEVEIFYKKYHTAAQTPQTLSNFLKAVNKKDALRRQIIIPEFLPEQIYEGTSSDKSITVKRYNRYTPVIPHKHSYFEIVYVFDGQCIQNVGFENFFLKRGDIIVTAPETFHTIEIFDDNAIIFEINLHCVNFYEMFAPLIKGSLVVNKFFAEGLHGKSPMKYLLFHTAGDEFLRKNILGMFDEETHSDDFTEQYLIGCLILGFVYVMRHYSKRLKAGVFQPSNLPDNFFVMNYIQKNLATVTLEELAKHFNFSLSHCSRMIKTSTGLGFKEWKQKLRLKRAEYLLTNTNQSVAEISSSLGWLNAENFIRAFQKELGITPAKYRKINRN